jgi:cytochrome bd ubiquinol oxidase subunit I
MDALALARLQFAFTTVYHFFFVPLTLGLSILVAVMETLYVRTGNETYKQMTKFWGKLFLINFAVGVVTGIVQEFQFGMNWSEYSRFVGDIFGAPLAIEALMAFFLESTFIAVWFFGWDKLGKRAHLTSIWLVVLASNLSALWILIANSFMQEPVGYVIRNGRAEMTDFMALITNPNVWVQWPHVFFAGLVTAAFFVLGVSAWHLRRKTNPDFFTRSFKIGTIAAVVGAIFVIFVGHAQGQHMVQTQPMKMAAAEALYDTEQPASFSLLTIGDLQGNEVFAIRIPGVLSLLSCNNFTCEVKGINELQAQYTQEFGPDDYAPPLAWTYWSFRVMVGAGFLMALLAFVALYLVLRNKVEQSRRFLRILPFAMLLPYLANTSGWLLTELGRQPWIVFQLMKTAAGVSNVVGGLAVLFSLVLFTAVYGVLMGVAIYLFNRFGKSDPVKDAQPVGLY